MTETVEQPRHPLRNALGDRAHLGFGGGCGGDEPRGVLLACTGVDAVEHGNVKVRIEKERGRKSLDERDGSATPVVDTGGTRLRPVPTEDSGAEDSTHVGQDVVTRAEETHQSKGWRQNPLSQRTIGKNVVDEKHRRLVHAPCGATWAQPGLACKTEQSVIAATVAVETNEAPRQVAARHKVFEFVLDKLWKSGGRLVGIHRALAQSLEVVPHGAMQQGALGRAGTVGVGGRERLHHDIAGGLPMGSEQPTCQR